MEKTVIVISGLMNTGKTATIKKFYEQLKSKYQKDLKEIYSRDNGSDIQRILELNLESNKIKIGINSIGDPDEPEKVKERLEKLWKEECRIIVCAARTKGETLNVLKGLNKVLVGLNMEKYKIIQFSNLHSWQKENTDTLNSQSSQLLFDVFKEVLTPTHKEQPNDRTNETQNAQPEQS